MTHVAYLESDLVIGRTAPDVTDLVEKVVERFRASPDACQVIEDHLATELEAVARVIRRELERVRMERGEEMHDYGGEIEFGLADSRRRHEEWS